MKTYKFPGQKTLFADQPLSAEALPQLLAEIFFRTDPFTGFLQISAKSGPLFFLFFLRNQPYAAGKFDSRKPLVISIPEFIKEIQSLSEARLSLHETDPVLIKSMLIFLQGEPTVKAPVNLIDLEQIVRRIFSEAGDALIVLERERMFNFFFIKDGKTAQPHYSDPDLVPAKDLSFEEQILLYAFEIPSPPAVAHIHRNIETAGTSEPEQIGSRKLLEMVQALSTGQAAAPAPPAAKEGDSLALEVMAGIQKGTHFTVALPCTLGRKGCDIIINDGLASRRHARLSMVDGQLMIEDLGSTNGTLLNGHPVKRATLAPTDLVTIGDTSLKIS
jgi:hypothetical protein